MSSRARNFRHAMERDEGFQFTRAGGCSPPGVRCDGKVGYSKQSNLACPNLTNRQTDARLIGPERLRKSAINMKSCGPRNISCVWKIGNLHRAEEGGGVYVKKVCGFFSDQMSLCFRAQESLRPPFCCYPFASFPLWLCRVLNSEKVSFGVLPPSILPLFSPLLPDRPPELGLQIVTCVKQHLIWSRSRRCPLPVSGVSTDQRSDPSSSKRRERRSPWLPDGYGQIFRSYVFGPSGLKDYGSATLRCKI